MNIFLSFKNTFLLFNAYFTSFLAYWAYKTPVPTPIKQNGNVKCNSLHIYAHICAYAYTYICAHLEALSSRCICPFLMRVFKSRPTTFLPFCKSTIESSSIQFEKNGQGHRGRVWSPDFSFRLCIQLTVSRQIWFHIWAAPETRMPNILLSSLFKYAAPHARIALRRDTASKIVPPSFDLCFE